MAVENLNGSIRVEVVGPSWEQELKRYFPQHKAGTEQIQPSMKKSKTASDLQST